MTRLGMIVRKTVALVALGGFAVATALEVAFAARATAAGCWHYSWSHTALLALGLSGVCLAIYGVARGTTWGRLAGLAVGLFGAWGAAWQLADPYFRSSWEAWLLAAGSAAVLLALVGRGMLARYDGRGLPEDASVFDRLRLAAVRLSAMVGIALLPFVASAFVRGGGLAAPLGAAHRPVLLALGILMLAGIGLAARQRTAGVLLLAVAGSAAAWLFAPVTTLSGHLMWFEAACRAGHTAAYLLPLALFAPAILRKLRA